MHFQLTIFSTFDEFIGRSRQGKARSICTVDVKGALKPSLKFWLSNLNYTFEGENDVLSRTNKEGPRTHLYFPRVVLRGQPMMV